MQTIQLQTIARLIGSELTVQITSGSDILIETTYKYMTEDVDLNWLDLEIQRAFKYALDRRLIKSIM